MELDDAGSGIPRPSRPRAHNRENSTNPPGSKADNIWKAPGTEEMLSCQGGN